MRISDWSSDVCSSDLLDRNPHPIGAGEDQPFPIRHQADMARKEDEVAAPEIARRHLLSKRRRLIVAVTRRKDSAQAERNTAKAGTVQPEHRPPAPTQVSDPRLPGDVASHGPAIPPGH